MAPKKRNCLTLDVKIEVLRKLDAGAKAKDLAEVYSVVPSTIAKIRKSRLEIEKNAASLGDQVKTAKKLSKSCHLEDKLLAWVTLKRQKGHPVSDPEVQAKAIELNKLIDGPEDFKVCSHLRSVI